MPPAAAYDIVVSQLAEPLLAKFARHLARTVPEVNAKGAYLDMIHETKRALDRGEPVPDAVWDSDGRAFTVSLHGFGFRFRLSGHRVTLVDVRP